MKVTIEFCDYWFKDKKGSIWNKGYFHINDKITAWVPLPDRIKAGDTVILTLGRDNDGRVKITLQK